MRGRRTASWALLAAISLPWPVVAGQTAEPPSPLWNYMASIDGLTHWLLLSAAASEVRTPWGPVTHEPRILVACREAEFPLNASLSVEAHRDSPIPSVFSPVAWWRALTGTGPQRTYAAPVTLGDATFETTWKLPESTYLITPDYGAELDAARTTEQLLGTTTAEPLILRVEGRIGVEARFRVDEAYRARLRQMRDACAGAGETRR